MDHYNILKKSNFNKYPEVKIKGHQCSEGWAAITKQLKKEILQQTGIKKMVVIDCYHGVFTNEIVNELKNCQIDSLHIIHAEEAMHPSDKFNKKAYRYVTDDPVFGYITPLEMKDLYSEEKIKQLRNEADKIASGVVIVIGPGASLIVSNPELLIYADMPRWEIQLRFRAKLVGNLGLDNKHDEFSYLYKRSFFVDWRICDKHKKTLAKKWHYVLDTTKAGHPKLASASAISAALKQTISQPFRLVPFFDPGPWGGQWLKEVCDLDPKAKNYAWGFDCVPEENSLVFRFGDITFELPSINLVFEYPEELLGTATYQTFGDEFPIRFDFLDTMGGGNLSLQVHPHLAYIREKFGMAYTQEESYYFMEAAEDAFVYLGLKEETVSAQMMTALENAQNSGSFFEADRFAEKWPVKKHDHILIPPGTVHCSGANSVVLEISATPFIFTFKLWDWGRMGLNGTPRPISLAHGENVIDWSRTTAWTKKHLINKTEVIAEGPDWKEERTGLHPDSFIETRRHWFKGSVLHHTGGVVNVLNLISGEEAIVESPSNAFDPFPVHYAETFIIPASVGAYTVRPYGLSEGKECATLKALIRTENLQFYKIG